MEIAQLFGFDRGRGFGHQVGGFGGFREGDHVADVRRAAKNCDQPVETEGDAAVRGRAVAKGFQHVAETRLHEAGRDLQDFFEDRFLHPGLVNADGAAAKLGAIDDDIVVLASHFFRIALEERHIFGDGRGEGMVAGIPAVLFLVKAQEGKIDDPKEIELVRRDDEFALAFQDFGAVEANAAENLAGIEPLIGGEENQVAFSNRQFADEGLLFGFGKEFNDG